MQSTFSENPEFSLAADFVLNTNETLFLTGKAGTGKTTFLRYIREQTHKNMVVAAPTGVAAINAGGVTLHSLFQLPFGPYLPLNTGVAAGMEVFTPHAVIKNLRFSHAKLGLLREMELLVID